MCSLWRGMHQHESLRSLLDGMFISMNQCFNVEIFYKFQTVFIYFLIEHFSTSKNNTFSIFPMAQRHFPNFFRRSHHCVTFPFRAANQSCKYKPTIAPVKLEKNIQTLQITRNISILILLHLAKTVYEVHKTASPNKRHQPGNCF
jgi:hypothetical protein